MGHTGMDGGCFFYNIKGVRSLEDGINSAVFRQIGNKRGTALILHERDDSLIFCRSKA